MADTYVERKHGREPVVYLFDELEPILKETYGVILYQEQVMKIAGALANYSMADADGLRKAMGKKIVSMMEAHRELFLKGARGNNRDLKKASELFDLMEKFGGYGFNKSHSAAYALIAYQTAYLKANFALEFIAALMTSEKGNTDAVIKFMEECRSHQIKVLPPDVNKSGAYFTVFDGCIRFGLAAVKNIGEGAIESIVETRNKIGEFKNLYDFCEQVNVSKVNKKVVEALIKCGAFDFTHNKRSQMMVVLEDALEHGSRVQKEKADSQLDLFADSNMGALLPKSTPSLPDIEEWDEQIRLSFEKESLGFYVSGHPLNKYEKIVQKYTSVNSINIHDSSDGKMIRMAGTIKPLKVHKTKKGDMMAFAAIEDQSGNIEVVVFPDLYGDVHMYLSGEEIVILEAMVQKKENIVKLIAEKIIPIEKASEEWASGVIIKLNAEKNSLTTLEQLKIILKKYPGDCPTFLNIEIEETLPVMIKLSNDYHTASDACFHKDIEELIGEGTVETSCAPVKAKQIIRKNWRNKQNGNGN
jgi:DNA polymerase-3 subunit alpha